MKFSEMNYVTTCVSLDSCSCCCFFFYQFESEKIVHVIPSDSWSCLNHNMPLCWGKFQIDLNSACKTGNFSVNRTGKPRSRFSLGLWNIPCEFIVWTCHTTRYLGTLSWWVLRDEPKSTSAGRWSKYRIPT